MLLLGMLSLPKEWKWQKVYKFFQRNFYLMYFFSTKNLLKCNFMYFTLDYNSMNNQTHKCEGDILLCKL